ncbi:MAG: phospholipase D-like domain-containing protein [Rugosibacter sp.]|nr:phospholipase D-like domain-containing protein [Rugosibacter sp.]
MGRLVYHRFEAPTATSPFDDAILEVARTGSVEIVSPYIGVAYLERIISVAGEWRLISDVEEWLSSLSVRARPKAWGFIRENLGRIHHCSAIHAKAVIGQSLAMIGSANLTNTGILGRTEMGILLDEPPMLAEIKTWFDGLWVQTASPYIDETSAFIQWLDEEASRTPSRRQKVSLSAKNKRFRASLVKLQVAPSIQPEGKPLDLGVVAQSLVVEEQRHYDSLDQAIDAAIDALAVAGFSLGDAVAYVRRGFSEAGVREVFFGLVQHCANYNRSVFAEGTHNRLTLIDGRFVQSTRQSIENGLGPYDLFMLFVIQKLDFVTPKALPSEDSIENETGMSGREQVILVSELLDCGFLVLDDVPGELPRYLLSADFEWELRFQLFKQAHAAWIALKNISHKAVQDTKDTAEQDGVDSVSTSIDTIGLSGLDDDDQSGDELSWTEIRKEQELAKASHQADRERIDREWHEKVDRVLAHLLEKLSRGEHIRVSTTQGLAALLAGETGVGKLLIRKMLDSREGYPQVFRLTPVTGGGNPVVRINPSLDWDHLEGYPQTLAVCKRIVE